MRNRVVFMIVLAALVSGVSRRVSAVNVTINPSVTYQTIKGYGCNFEYPAHISPELADDLYREMVQELGINRLRMEVPGGNRRNTTPFADKRWEWLNDDDDPLTFNWSAFNTTSYDNDIIRTVLPIKSRVEARGEEFDIYVSPSFFDSGSTGAVPEWMRRNPGEYAEYALALLLHLKNVYGIEADFYSILNEPGNNNPFSASVVSRMIKNLGPILRANGFSTMIQFPECVNVDTAYRYATDSSVDDEVWSWVGLVSYHHYGAKTHLADLRHIAFNRGIPTGQTEYMWLKTSLLYDDMTLGGASYWEYYLMQYFVDFSANEERFVRKGKFWSFRQLTHYVRPGAVRVAAVSDDSRLRVLAFEKGTKSVVVVLNDLDTINRTVHLSGLKPGQYGISKSRSNSKCQELGIVMVEASSLGRPGTATPSAGVLSMDVTGGTVQTLYPYDGVNLPPTVTDYKASADFLTQPSNSATLTASATDAELDPITYSWSVFSKPAAASVVIANRTSGSTSVSGLTETGKYVFSVSISDGNNTVTRKVRIPVYGGNRPPTPMNTHCRKPVLITLPTSSAELRTYGRDPEGVTCTYQWSIVSQPAGANAVLAANTATKCPVSGMTVAGDYVFDVDISDGVNTITDSITVPVYPKNLNTPSIRNAAASPSVIMLPASTSSLSATTSDTDGDWISHWWECTGRPAGAPLPTYSAQSSASTSVSNLTSVGTYTFTLTVVDRTKYTSRMVTVTVNPSPGPNTAPTVDAGSDQNITLPTDSISLDATITDDGEHPPG